jgi:hypothetical protein
MADHIYEIGGQVTTGNAAGPIITVIAAALGAGIRVPEIREMGLTLNTAVACEFSVGTPGNTPATPTAPLTVQAINHQDPAGHTTVAGSTWSTTPTVPANPTRRAQLPATIGAGVIWVWNPGEFQLYSTTAPGQFLSVWQLSVLAVNVDWYVKVAE